MNSPSSVVLVVALVFGLASWASARVARAEVTSRPPERVDAARDDEPPRVPGVAVLRGPSEQLRMKLAEARAELGCRLEALERLAGEVMARGTARGEAPDRIEKVYRQFADSHLAVAVIASPKASEKVPEIEQVYSAGAVCLSLLNAALASGWGANWLSGWACHDPEFLSVALGIEPHESVAGFIHIGTETAAPPERPRPDLEAITTWVSQ